MKVISQPADVQGAERHIYISSKQAYNDEYLACTNELFGINTLHFSFSLFDNCRSTIAKNIRVSWQQIIKAFARHEKRSDKDGRLFSPVEYSPNSRRSKDNVVTVSCLVLDFDNGITPDVLTPDWQNRDLAFTIYSTHSHTASKQKWRAIFPLAEPVNATEWSSTYSRLTSILGGGQSDPACKDISRMYYMPSCPEERHNEAFCATYDGAALHVKSFLNAFPNAKEVTPLNSQITSSTLAFSKVNDKYAQAAISAEIRHLSRSTQGERNTTLNKAAFRIGQLVRTGLYTRSDAESELLRTAMSIGLTIDEALRTIKSGLDNGEKTAGGSEYSLNATPPFFLRTKEISDTGGNPQKTTNFSPKFDLYPLKSLDSLPTPKWLIQNILMQCTTSVLSAASGSFKSFIALDMALSIATGRAWHGCEVQKGAVINVASEGFYTLRDRATAWAQHHNCPLPENFDIVNVPVNLSSPHDLEAFQNTIADRKPVFIVLDTLSQCAIGANENDNSQMADFIRGMMKLSQDIEAHVQVIHHNAKTSGTFRGAVAIKANVDSHISILRPPKDTTNLVEIHCEKQRAKPFDAFTLRGIEITLPYTDEFDMPITSLVFEKCEENVGESASRSRNAKKKEGVKEKIMRVFDNIEAENGSVSLVTWKTAVVDITPRICGESTFWKYRKELEESGIIASCGMDQCKELFRRAVGTPLTLSTPGHSG